jgi:hypothetical protein
VKQQRSSSIVSNKKNRSTAVDALLENEMVQRLILKQNQSLKMACAARAAF